MLTDACELLRCEVAPRNSTNIRNPLWLAEKGLDFRDTEAIIRVTDIIMIGYSDRRTEWINIFC